MLTGKDDDHCKDIQTKLEELVSLLDSAMRKPGWLPEGSESRRGKELWHKLECLQKDVATLDAERERRKVTLLCHLLLAFVC